MLDDKTIAAIANEAVKAIVRDMTDRSGLGNEWEGIDNEIQAEIVDKWKGIVAQSVRSKIKP